jgi:hypothetical protein
MAGSNYGGFSWVSLCGGYWKACSGHQFGLAGPLGESLREKCSFQGESLQEMKGPRGPARSKVSGYGSGMQRRLWEPAGGMAQSRLAVKR